MLGGGGQAPAWSGSWRCGAVTGRVPPAGSRWASRLGFSGARPRRPGCLPGRRRSRPWRPWPGSRGFVVGVLGLASSFRCRARLRGLAGVGPLGCRRRRPPSRGPPLPSVRPAFGGRCCCGGGGRSRPGLRLRQRAARASAGPDGPNSPPLRSGAGASPARVVPARGVAAGGSCPPGQWPDGQKVPFTPSVRLCRTAPPSRGSDAGGRTWITLLFSAKTGENG